MIWHFNTSFLVSGKRSRQKKKNNKNKKKSLSNNIKNMSKTFNQLDLIDIYRTLFPTAAKDILFKNIANVSSKRPDVEA